MNQMEFTRDDMDVLMDALNCMVRVAKEEVLDKQMKILSENINKEMSINNKTIDANYLLEKTLLTKNIALKIGEKVFINKEIVAITLKKKINKLRNSIPPINIKQNTGD